MYGFVFIINAVIQSAALSVNHVCFFIISIKKKHLPPIKKIYIKFSFFLRQCLRAVFFKFSLKLFLSCINSSLSVLSNNLIK